MQRPVTKGKSAGASAGAGDLSFAADYPLLHSYLSDETYDDGSARERSTVSVFFEDGVVKAALNDKDMKRSAYVSANAVDDLWMTLEAGLSGDKLDWRQWHKGTKKK